MIRHSITIVGTEETVIDGGGQGTVLLIEAPDVTITGLLIRNTGISLDRENSGIESNAPRTTITHNRLEDVLFGVFLRQAPDSVVADNVISGKDLPLGRRGDAIRLWESSRSHVVRNTITDTRDVVLWFSDGLVIQDNTASGGRYGLHFMYSDFAVVERNELTDNSVGAFLMYSRDLTLTDNVMARNNGPSGFGIGFKDVDGIYATGNRFIDNRIGVHLDNSPWSYDRWQTFDGNLFAFNEIGVGFLPAVRRNIFTGNAFVDNADQVAVLGSGQFFGNEWSLEGTGNFWSDFAGYDADGDGIGDLSYRLEDLYSTLTDDHPELTFFSDTPAARALGVASRLFPVLKPRPKVEDTAPLVDMPVFPPVRGDSASRVGTGLLAASLSLLAFSGLLVGLASTRRSRRSTP